MTVLALDSSCLESVTANLMPSLTLDYQPFAKQREFHSSRSRYKLYGGGMGGGKTYALCAEVIMLLSEYAGNRGVIVRKTMTNLRRTTMVTFFKLCPEELIRSYNQMTGVVEFVNGSVLLFMDADVSKDIELNKLKGLEIGFFGIEEANEVSERVFQILTTRLRWKLPNGTEPLYFGLLTSNPETSWVKKRFIDKFHHDHEFVSSLPSENPFLPSEYLESLDQILSDDDKQKYLFGNWTIKDNPQQLIKYVWLRRGIETFFSAPASPPPEKRFLGVDVARYGDDSSVIATVDEQDETMQLIDLETHKHQSTTTIAKHLENRIRSEMISPENVIIDAVGLGAGVVDYLHSRELMVAEFIGGSKAKQTSRLQFNNLRSQAFWSLRELLKDNKLQMIDNIELTEELLNHNYEIQSDKRIKIESKDEIRKRIGRSPDYADAVSMATFRLLNESSVVGRVLLF